MIDGLVLLESTVFHDNRGFFYEVFNLKNLKKYGITTTFVQCNHSMSDFGVLRGLHFQVKNPQAKLVRVLNGEILDLAVDLRRDSKTFGKVYKVLLSRDNGKMLYIPEGFAHGFLSLSSKTEVEYYCSDYYSPEHESGIIWNDKDLEIDYELEAYGLTLDDLIISEKDRVLSTLKEFVASGVKIG
ncbi:dTDP-4-dehydrorhamnose 3,5-epimerase [Cetobacterium sp.]|uniref:dTDP-4-dehydrorhamnose 3,5-epimerase n=1 Tax=Cetobacterium sp. TaxID=2071632 RepID=UPI003F36D3DF